MSNPYGNVYKPNTDAPDIRSPAYEPAPEPEPTPPTKD